MCAKHMHMQPWRRPQAQCRLCAVLDYKCFN